MRLIRKYLVYEQVDDPTSLPVSLIKAAREATVTEVQRRVGEATAVSMRRADIENGPPREAFEAYALEVNDAAVIKRALEHYFAHLCERRDYGLEEAEGETLERVRVHGILQTFDRAE